jgi:hypothetical protein
MDRAALEDDIDCWPLSLQRLARLVGPSATLALVAHFGGTEKNYIPKVLPDDHKFYVCLSPEQMLKLMNEFAGKNLEIPRLYRRGFIKQRILDAKGNNNQTIAREVGCSARYVRKVRNGLPAPLPLFPDD